MNWPLHPSLALDEGSTRKNLKQMEIYLCCASLLSSLWPPCSSFDYVR